MNEIQYESLKTFGNALIYNPKSIVLKFGIETEPLKFYLSGMPCCLEFRCNADVVVHMCVICSMWIVLSDSCHPPRLTESIHKAQSQRDAISQLCCSPLLSVGYQGSYSCGSKGRFGNAILSQTLNATRNICVQITCHWVRREFEEWWQKETPDPDVLLPHLLPQSLTKRSACVSNLSRSANNLKYMEWNDQSYKM